jgi:hypothetical protein
MVRDGEFFDVDQHHIIAHYVVTHKAYLVNDHIITQIAANDGTVIDPYGHAEVIELVKERLQFSDADASKKTATLDQASIKKFCYFYIVPVIGTIIVLLKYLDLFCIELSVLVVGSMLAIAQVELILPLWEVRLVDKTKPE